MKLPVAIIQGFGAPTFTNLPIKLRLIRDGFRAFDLKLPGVNLGDIRESAQQIAEQAHAVMQKTSSSRIDLIGVSMGGLIGLYFIRRLEGYKFVRRFVALGTPFHGTSIARVPQLLYGERAAGAAQMVDGSDFLRDLHTEPYTDAETYSVLAKGDAFVSRKSATLPGAKLIFSEFGFWPLGHYTPIVHPSNYRIVREILEG